MKLHISSDYERMSSDAAQYIIEFVRQKEDSLLSLAGGMTPLRTFSLLLEAAEQGRVSFAKCRFVSLDEWVGLNEKDEGSCKRTLYEHFFARLNIGTEQIRFFDGRSADLAGECAAMDAFIERHGQIDLMLLGVGLNGHLGFNEPGCSMGAYSRVVELDSVTKTVSAKYFSETKELHQGITLGMKHIMEASAVMLLADGEKKAAIVQKTVRGAASVQVPASMLQNHANAHVFLDKKAASAL